MGSQALREKQRGGWWLRPGALLRIYPHHNPSKPGLNRMCWEWPAHTWASQLCSLCPSVHGALERCRRRPLIVVCLLAPGAFCSILQTWLNKYPENFCGSPDLANISSTSASSLTSLRYQAYVLPGSDLTLRPQTVEGPVSVRLSPMVRRFGLGD